VSLVLVFTVSIVLTLNQVCGFKFQVFTGSSIHPPLGALSIMMSVIRETTMKYHVFVL
jgi:hypothetical protein